MFHTKVRWKYLTLSIFGNTKPQVNIFCMCEVTTSLIVYFINVICYVNIFRSITTKVMFELSLSFKLLKYLPISHKCNNLIWSHHNRIDLLSKMSKEAVNASYFLWPKRENEWPANEVSIVTPYKVILSSIISCQKSETSCENSNLTLVKFKWNYRLQ